MTKKEPKLYEVQYWPEDKDEKELCPNIWRMEEIKELEHEEGVALQFKDSDYTWYQVEKYADTAIEAFIIGYKLIQEKIKGNKYEL
jgi:hypothetical protein